jgi:uncharacterized protein YlzI (FlbEa/FlbD family)
MILEIVVHLIVLHTLDGHEVVINPKQVTSLRAAKDDQPNKFYTDDVRCIISLTDGKIITVPEHCDDVQKLLEDAQ